MLHPRHRCSQVGDQPQQCVCGSKGARLSYLGWLGFACAGWQLRPLLLALRSCRNTKYRTLCCFPLFTATHGQVPS